MQLPFTPKQVESFLGLSGYYRKFVKNYATIAKPLTSCIKNSKVEHTPAFIHAFETIKQLLCNEPILAYPDFKQKFILTRDASSVGLGAVLSQGKIGSDRPIAFNSRTLNEHEVNYSTIEKECLAIVRAVKQFRPYLYGNKFTIITDHRPLQWLFNIKEPNSKLVRWRLKLSEYDYDIVYKKGKYNTNADFLSRLENHLMETSETPDDLLSIFANPGDIADRQMLDIDIDILY